MKKRRSDSKGLFIMMAAVFLTAALIAGIALTIYLRPQTTTEPEKAVKTIQVVSMGTEPACGMTRFYEKLDALTIPELGFRVRVEYIPWARRTSGCHA
ncbi:MAG: hypothetical protein ACI4MG_04905 [Aristaeellaceae bacterium]